MAMRLTFGYLTCQQAGAGRTIGVAVEEALGEARLAEQLGFGGVYVSEHHQRADQFIPSPFPFAAYLAGGTSTIRIGVAVALVLLYHPLRLMEDATTVDIVSQGRSVLGMGLGYIGRDFEVYGLEREEAARKYRELLPQIARGWEEGFHIDAPGATAHVDDFSPRPIQQPRPPVWIAANTKLGVRMAADFGDCWIAGARIPIDRAAQLAAEYRRRCAEVGKTARVAVIRDAWVADSTEQAWDQTGEFLLASLRPQVADGRVREPEESMNPRDWADVGEGFSRLARGRWLIGDTAAVAEQIGEWVERAGADEIIVRFKQASGPTGDAVQEQMRRWHADVMSRFST
jgi:alkanesulfonate monooxygenase SsuD/methylene tetrahydromethanopterin reductase-like flavin-dependent oxidoreductase (luciferase family)